MLTFSRIKRILQSCAFKPTDPGPMKIIAEVGNPRYYRQRACEILKSIDELEDPTRVHSCDEMKKAISLLALAVAEIELNEEPVERNVPVDRDVTCC